MNYWLFKSEPDEFSIDDLKKRGEVGECWDGVRNYQARNFLRDEIKLNDTVLFYHSSCRDVGIAGIAKVIRTAFPDPSQFNPESRYYDGKASTEKPRWFSVQIQFVEQFSPIIPLAYIKQQPTLVDFQLVKKGNRLSVFPVSSAHYANIMSLK